MTYPSYRIIPNHTESQASHNLHLFTLRQPQMMARATSVQGFEHLLLPEATLGLGMVYCLVHKFLAFRGHSTCQICWGSIVPRSEPTWIAFLTNLCKSGCTDTCSNRWRTIFTATVLISHTVLFDFCWIVFVFFTLPSFKISYLIYAGSKQRLSWLLRCRSMLIPGRFGPEPIIPDPQLQHLCYSHGQDLSILSPAGEVFSRSLYRCCRLCRLRLTANIFRCRFRGYSSSVQRAFVSYIVQTLESGDFHGFCEGLGCKLLNCFAK